MSGIWFIVANQMMVDNILRSTSGDHIEQHLETKQQLSDMKQQLNDLKQQVNIESCKNMATELVKSLSLCSEIPTDSKKSICDNFKEMHYYDCMMKKEASEN